MTASVFKREVDRLTAIIEALVSYHPAGILILLGERPALSSSEWADLIEAVKSSPEEERVDVSPSTDAFFHRVAEGLDITRYLEKYGGWKSVVEASKNFRARNPQDWNLFVEALRLEMDPLSSRLQGSGIERISAMYGVSRKTVLRRRRIVPFSIAQSIVSGFQRALFSS